MSEREDVRQKILDLRSKRDDLIKREFDLIAPYKKEKLRLDRKYLSRSAELNRIGHERFLVMVKIEKVQWDLDQAREESDKLMEQERVILTSYPP